MSDTKDTTLAARRDAARRELESASACSAIRDTGDGPVRPETQDETVLRLAREYREACAAVAFITKERNRIQELIDDLRKQFQSTEKRYQEARSAHFVVDGVLKAAIMGETLRSQMTEFMPTAYLADDDEEDGDLG